MLARNEPIAAPISFVRGTLTPLAAAARSLARTASIRRPTRERRTFTTTMAHATVTSRTKNPKARFGYPPLRPRAGCRG